MRLTMRRSDEIVNTRSGVYMGGIGSGGFEVRPDGRFYNCQIYNEWQNRGMLDAYIVHHDGKDARILSMMDLPSTGERIQGVSDIVYKGEFPKASLRIPSRNVLVEFTSFFIPGDVKDSSLPAVLIRVKGKGRLGLFLGGKYKATPSIDANSVILQSPEGGLGMRSMRGKPSVCLQNRRWLMFRKVADPEAAQRIPEPDLSEPATYYAGMEWNRLFDDEVVLAWHYPVSLDNDGNDMGQYYTNHFTSCKQAMSYVWSNRRKLKSGTDRFHRTVHDSNQPVFLKDAYSAQVASFVKQSWHTKDGKFGVWEGSCCCCGVQTTDVAYYGSWIYAKMFPELEKSGIRLTAKFQREDGWIPHFFPGTFSRIDEYRRKDMNMQFVLMVCRDYLLWDDNAFLKEMYPAVKKAMACVYEWDRDGDLMPEIEGNAQTFDSWGFTGCAIYTASLWLGALRAGAQAASALGDTASAKKWAADATTVAENIVKTFWNGEYFVLAVDHGRKDEGCLIDALSGDWYSRLLGLGGILDDDKVVSHLQACLKYNRKKMAPDLMLEYGTPGETGYCYINGGYDDDRRIGCQQYEPWTGMEYAFALHLALTGMQKQALQVAKDVADRKAACGMTWNHQECGGDYFRPMVIGALWEKLTAKPAPRSKPKES